MMHLDHYGLHWMEGDIALLVQQDRVDHVLGIPMEFPVDVKNRVRKIWQCPHNINLDDAVQGDLPDCELVRAMLPVPKTPGELNLFVDEKHFGYVKNLLRLSSAKDEQYPVWMMEPKVADARLYLTNLSPLIVFGYNPHQAQRLHQLIQQAAYCPRRLIFIGPESVVLRPEMKRVEVNPVPLPDNLPQIGAWHLKQRMLGHVN